MIITLDKCLSDPQLLGQFLEGDTWNAWRTLWRAAFALPPQDGDLETFRVCTERAAWPERPAREIWIICGRRAGKSVNASLLATFTAAFQRYKQLSSGEIATIPIISPTRLQSGIIKNYISSFFADNEYLRGLVQDETRWEIRLKNRVTIQILTSDFRSMRGFSCPLVILEECGFFYAEGTRTDTEAVRAVRPSLATLNGVLVAISSPFARTGALFKTYDAHFGRDNSDIFVWKAPSTAMNPSLDTAIIKAALEEDREAGESEWEAEFRRDLSSFVDRDVVEAAIVEGRTELPPVVGIIYSGFVDMSGGSGQDSATLAIAHNDKGIKVIDCVREARPPFNPDQILDEFASIFKRYGITFIHGDRWAGGWPAARFSKRGIRFDTEALNKTNLYLELLAPLNSGEVELLDHEVLKKQLCSLERRIHSGGRQTIDHPRGRHDDVANSVAGVCYEAGAMSSSFFGDADLR